MYVRSRRRHSSNFKGLVGVNASLLRFDSRLLEPIIRANINYDYLFGIMYFRASIYQHSLAMERIWTFCIYFVHTHYICACIHIHVITKWCNDFTLFWRFSLYNLRITQWEASVPTDFMHPENWLTDWVKPYLLGRCSAIENFLVPANFHMRRSCHRKQWFHVKGWCSPSFIIYNSTCMHRTTIFNIEHTYS